MVWQSKNPKGPGTADEYDDYCERMGEAAIKIPVALFGDGEWACFDADDDEPAEETMKRLRRDQPHALKYIYLVATVPNPPTADHDTVAAITQEDKDDE